MSQQRIQDLLEANNRYLERARRYEHAARLARAFAATPDRTLPDAIALDPMAMQTIIQALIEPASPQPPAADFHCCFICGEPLVAGQMVLDDINAGLGHRDCFGNDRDGFVNLDTGEPIGPNDPLPAGEPYSPADYAEIPQPPVADQSAAGEDAVWNAAIAAATKFVTDRRDAYIEEHGSYDWETGATEFGNSAGEEYVSELDEIEEGIKALFRSTLKSEG